MAYVSRIPASVTNDGQLSFADPVAWRALLARHRGRAVYVTVVRQQHARTMPQNRYYWSVVVDGVAAYIGEGRDETHELLKAKFLKPRRVELLDGQTLEMPASTRLLTIEQMTEYIEAIRVWAATFLGLSVPDANQVETAA